MAPERSVACPYCRAEQGDPCVTRSGRVITLFHWKRTETLRSRRRGDSQWVAVWFDYEELDIRKGDVFLAKPDSLSPHKYILLERAGDGYSPEYSEHSQYLKFLGFDGETVLSLETREDGSLYYDLS